MRKKSHKMSHHFRPALNNLDCEEDIWYFTAGEKALSIKSSYLSLHSCCTETATTLIGPGKVSRKILHQPPPITRGKKKQKTDRAVPGSQVTFCSCENKELEFVAKIYGRRTLLSHKTILQMPIGLNQSVRDNGTSEPLQMVVESFHQEKETDVQNKTSLSFSPIPFAPS